MLDDEKCEKRRKEIKDQVDAKLEKKLFWQLTLSFMSGVLIVGGVVVTLSVDMSAKAHESLLKKDHEISATLTKKDDEMSDHIHANTEHINKVEYVQGQVLTKLEAISDKLEDLEDNQKENATRVLEKLEEIQNGAGH